MKNEKTRIRFFKFSDGKQNLQFHWPYSELQKFCSNPPLHICLALFIIIYPLTYLLCY
jgi:cytochrome c2